MISYLAVIQYVTNVSDDVGKLRDFLSALLELRSNTVAPTDVPAHLVPNTHTHTSNLYTVAI